MERATVIFAPRFRYYSDYATHGLWDKGNRGQGVGGVDQGWRKGCLNDRCGVEGAVVGFAAGDFGSENRRLATQDIGLG